ncbi:Eukaryotic translation initiation factor 3 subunit B, partial [Frankliniella fusca]
MVCFCPAPQPNDQRAGGPAEQGQVAAVQHEAAAAPGREHTAPPHPLLPHLTRLRLASHRRSPHRLPELPVRVAQDAGQELPQPGRREPPGQQAQGPRRHRPQEVNAAGE